MAAPPAPAETASPSATATRLLDVAERLFAERGIEAVSIRQIVLASGQGNASAAHYHFGSREVLIRQLLERRMETVDAMRHARLDDLLARTPHPDIRAVIGTSIATLVGVVRTHAWGADYVQVIAQALFNPRMRLLESIDPRAISGLTRMIGLCRRSLPDMPRAVFDARMTLIQHETAYTFARWLHANGGPQAGQGEGNAALAAMAAQLTEFMSAGLAAPVTGTEPRPRRARDR